MTGWGAGVETVGLVLAGGWCLERAWLGFHWRWVRTRMPVSHARSVAIGRAVVVGTVRADGPGRSAPVSGRAAVCWEMRGGLFNRVLDWEIARRADPFRLEDATGRLRVEPAGGRLEVPACTAVWDDGAEVSERSVGIGDTVAVYGEAVPSGEGAEAVLRRPAYGEMIIWPADGAAPGPETARTLGLFGLGSFLLVMAALRAPEGVLAHPLRTLGPAVRILLGTFLAGAGLARLLRKARIILEDAEGVSAMSLALLTGGLFAALLWWLGALAGFFAFPFADRL